ncbi:MAG: ATP-binding protein [Chlamydiae bacterium]|nr:ATP-binding protein [Chlamydiota bacterium]MBI3265568.1 ATP-binding protein [Chlamydiota bacterium]
MKNIRRAFWISKIEELWEKRSIVWLSGVRRAGKTTLAHSLEKIEYFDCELPRVRQMMEDPEDFLESFHGQRIILDEVHRLDHPAEILKIAADHYPKLKILATGSSTLGASKKFRDTLTGRKAELWLTPMISSDLKSFAREDLGYRFLHGGLPPFFLSDEVPERDFQEWMDAYWAKDIQELFRLERRHSFQKFSELLMVQSGGIFEATNFARPCEVSRSTISNYLQVLEETFVMHVVRPFNSHRAAEIVAAPKVYAFDTGFVSYYRGWSSLRRQDFGILWEHFVLNELYAHLQRRDLHYWRDKRGHEVDFVFLKRGKNSMVPITLECKWASSEFDPTSLKAFRHPYPRGENFVVSHGIKRSYERHYDEIKVVFVSLEELIQRLQ